MMQLKQNGANIIEFVDDNLTSVRSHVVDLCKAIIKNDLNIMWGTHVRIDEVDFELLSLMKNAGCVYVRCGIESGSSEIIEKIKKAKSADTWNEKASQFFNWTAELGIMTVAYLILGLPDEKMEDVAMTKDLILSVNPDIIKIHSFSPYPGTTIYDDLKLNTPPEELSTIFHHGSYASQKDSVAWQNLENDINRSFYLRIKYILKHAFTYSGFYLFNMHSTLVLIKYVIRILSTYFLKNKRKAVPCKTKPSGSFKEHQREHQEIS